MQHSRDGDGRGGTGVGYFSREAVRDRPKLIFLNKSPILLILCHLGVHTLSERENQFLLLLLRSILKEMDFFLISDGTQKFSEVKRSF